MKYKYRVEVSLTDERNKLNPTVMWEGNDWSVCVEKFLYWANEYRDIIDRVSIRVRE